MRSRARGAKLLTLIGWLMVLMAALLVANTIAAVLAGQVRQIGVMKTLGAGVGQMAVMYVGLALAFGTIGLLLAIPISVAGAWALGVYALGVVNFDPPPAGLPPGVVALMALSALGVPLLAAAVPIRSTLRMSVREAIANVGSGSLQFGQAWIDRWLERVRGLPRPVMLSLRNTFRRKGRLWLTLSTLVLAGGVFIGVLSVREALLLSVHDEFRYMGYDAQITLAQPSDVETVERAARDVSGINAAEGWLGRAAYRVRPDGSESGTLALIGPPAASGMLEPVLLEGRWLAPSDTDAVVITSDLLQSESDVRVGEQLMLNVDGRSISLRIVGLVKTYRFDRQVGPSIYVEGGGFGRVIRAEGRVNTLQITTPQHDAATQAAAATRVRIALESAEVQPRTIVTGSARRALRDDIAGIILTFLVLMAVLLAIVGGLGLAGTMSMNVLERTREIGVMRSIGASNRDIVRIVVVEGVAIAVLAWVAGALIAIPVSRYLNGLVGQIFLHQPVPDVFSPTSVVLWLGLAVALAVVSTMAPALGAARATVRQALAYE